MFVYSVRASSIKFFAVVLLVLFMLGGILFLGGEEKFVSAAVSDKIDFSGVKTNEDRISFISGFGVKVDTEPFEVSEFKVPENFDRIINGYNEIQK